METIIINGLRNIQNGVVTTPIKVNFPKRWKVTPVLNFDEFKEYKWHSGSNNDIEWEYIISQDFDRNCNGYSVYWLAKVKKYAINRKLKQIRSLTVGEAWNFGDKID